MGGAFPPHLYSIKSQRSLETLLEQFQLLFLRTADMKIFASRQCCSRSFAAVPLAPGLYPAQRPSLGILSPKIARSCLVRTQNMLSSVLVEVNQYEQHSQFRLRIFCAAHFLQAMAHLFFVPTRGPDDNRGRPQLVCSRCAQWADDADEFCPKAGMSGMIWPGHTHTKVLPLTVLRFYFSSISRRGD
jgi:hypothetical protein